MWPLIVAQANCFREACRKGAKHLTFHLSLFLCIGLDQNQDEVENTWTIKFTNECGMLPLVDGTEFGLVIFVSFVSWCCTCDCLIESSTITNRPIPALLLLFQRNLVRPSQELCPIDDPPTLAPSPSPTPAPSPSPVGSLSQSYSYSRVFSKASKNSKSAKDTKKGGGKSGKSRRALQTSTSDNTYQEHKYPIRHRRLQS